MSWTAGLLALVVHAACTSSGGPAQDGDVSGSGGAPGAESGGAPAAASGGMTTEAGGAGAEPNAASGGESAAGGGSGGASAAGGAVGIGGEPSGSGGVLAVEGLSWPIDWPVDCEPGSTCYDLGYPDADGDGVAFDCSEPGYFGHEGTDIPITWEEMDAGVAVRAAADGTVFFAADGKYDRCPDASQPDCENPPAYVAGGTEGTTVCTELGPYCNPPGGSCFWCFAGGNVIVILHDTVQGVFATRYDHLRNGSVQVEVGQQVTRGQKIAEVGSAGNSSGPHLHFEVWGDGYYDVIEPWAGSCGPNTTASLWVEDPPWDE